MRERAHRLSRQAGRNQIHPTLMNPAFHPMASRSELHCGWWQQILKSDLAPVALLPGLRGCVLQKEEHSWLCPPHAFASISIHENDGMAMTQFSMATPQCWPDRRTESWPLWKPVSGITGEMAVNHLIHCPPGEARSLCLLSSSPCILHTAAPKVLLLTVLRARLLLPRSFKLFVQSSHKNTSPHFQEFSRKHFQGIGAYWCIVSVCLHQIRTPRVFKQTGGFFLSSPFTSTKETWSMNNIQILESGERIGFRPDFPASCTLQHEVPNSPLGHCGNTSTFWIFRWGKKHFQWKL